MNVLEPLVEMYGTNLPRALAITACMLVTLICLIWVSIIDIKKRSITFWKMLVASSTIMIGPIVVSLFYHCSGLTTMKYHLWYSIPIWFLLLYLNIKLNRDRFMGKADIDLLSAVVAIGIPFTVWLWQSSPTGGGIVRITGFWYSVLGYLLIGALVYLAIFLVIVVRELVFKHRTMKQLLKDTRISVIPMFVPVSVMVPYMILIS